MELSCTAGLTYCTAQGGGLQPGCFDLMTDPNHCGACDSQCRGDTCVEGQCTKTAAQSAASQTTPDDATATDAAPDAERAANAAGPSATSQVETSSRATRAPKEARGQANQGTTTASSTEALPRSVLSWPFESDAGQWTIVHGYSRQEAHRDEATPDPQAPRDEERFALDLGVCAETEIDSDQDVCNLGDSSSAPVWDLEATRGADVLSPVDGTVAWVENVSARCRRVGLEIAGRPGFRLTLSPLTGKLEQGQAVVQGKRIGKIAPSGEQGCEDGGVLRMALYQPQPGTDDPPAGRTSVPFAGDWAIAGCDYSADQRTREQYQGELVPCSSADLA
ncbi:MAG: hypothetical protein M3Z20_19200 [Chloroflexota bacterium]|nr:hypothetical protein [Chloroflexota bacterium]